MSAFKEFDALVDVFYHFGYPGLGLGIVGGWGHESFFEFQIGDLPVKFGNLLPVVVIFSG